MLSAILKCCSKLLVSVLDSIFKKTTVDESFLDKLKLSGIVPILKKKNNDSIKTKSSSPVSTVT